MARRRAGSAGREPPASSMHTAAASVPAGSAASIWADVGTASTPVR